MHQLVDVVTPNILPIDITAGIHVTDLTDDMELGRAARAGRAEPASVQVVDMTRAEFAESVRAALPRFRFSPGEAGGRKVRTRVQIPFDFTLR